MLTRIKKSAFLTLLLFGSAHVLADSRDLEQYALTYSVAELTTLQGMQNVYDRIQRAAKDYCPTYRVIRSRADVKTCVNGVVEDLVAKTNDAKFIAFVAGEMTAQDEQLAQLLETGTKSTP